MPDFHSTGAILVLEDSDEDFDTLTEALQQSSLTHPLLRVETGDACLEALMTGVSREPRPALVLLDLNTPGLDGRSALQEIRADRKLATLPIVVLSTSMDPRDVDGSYRAGANAYHIKPTRYPAHVELVIGILRYWLARVIASEKEA